MKTKIVSRLVLALSLLAPAAALADDAKPADKPAATATTDKPAPKKKAKTKPAPKKPAPAPAPAPATPAK